MGGPYVTLCPHRPSVCPDDQILAAPSVPTVMAACAWCGFTRHFTTPGCGSLANQGEDGGHVISSPPITAHLASSSPEWRSVSSPAASHSEMEAA